RGIPRIDLKYREDYMSVFNPQKLSVKLIPPATFTQPVEGRKYTLTHSDITAELFLDIGYVYNEKSINPKMRDEVLANWKKDSHGRLNLVGKAYIDGGEFSQKVAGIRFRIFKKEMATALKGIVYGDRPFYVHYPFLLNAPIFIHYLSIYPQYRQVAYYGTPRQYLNQIYQTS
ncbi:MAG TPA: staygreen family protein, partial [Bacillota bacterium]|nr:staygreen family protein [Bacillota bacterium]